VEAGMKNSKLGVIHNSDSEIINNVSCLFNRLSWIGDPSTLMELAALGNVPVQRLTHRAFILKGKSSFEVAGHEIGKHNLLRGIHRICPACFWAETGGHIAENTLPNAYARILGPICVNGVP
jgi:hypothetical protein